MLFEIRYRSVQGEQRTPVTLSATSPEHAIEMFWRTRETWKSIDRASVTAHEFVCRPSDVPASLRHKAIITHPDIPASYTHAWARIDGSIADGIAQRLVDAIATETGVDVLDAEIDTAAMPLFLIRLTTLADDQMWESVWCGPKDALALQFFRISGDTWERAEGASDTYAPYLESFTTQHKEQHA